MLDNFYQNKIINNLPSYEDFAIEFKGYNFDCLCSNAKTYIKVPFTQKTITDKITILNHEEMEVLSQTVDNDFFSSFISERYALYDISFRCSNGVKGISLNFNDVRDGTYISTKAAFSPFRKLDVDLAVNSTHKIKHRMFNYEPTYNPVFMIGLLYMGNKFKAFKSYIRFNHDDFPSVSDRSNLINCILNNSEPNCYVLNVTDKLESLGFMFSFVGVDCYTTGNERLKLYFRYHGKKEFALLWNEISSILKQNNLINSLNDSMFCKSTGVWGIAISVCEQSKINGIQLYLYP